MQIALTKKVQDYLGIKTLESYKEQDHFLNDWLVNFFTRRRRKIFVFMNRKTKFVVVVPFTSKKELIFDFAQKFELELLKAGVPNEMLGEMYFGYDSTKFVKNENRSDTAYLTLVTSDIKNFIYNEMFWRENLSELVNTTLVKFKDDNSYSDPVEKLFKELKISFEMISYEEYIKHNTKK